MDSVFNYFDWFAGVLGGALGWYFGGLDGFLYALLTLAVVDYITGMLAAVVKKELSSSIGFHGIARKIGMFALVGVANIFDKDFLGGTDVVKTAVIFFYLANEGLSILENVVELKVPVPEILKEKLLQFRGDGKEPKSPKSRAGRKDAKSGRDTKSANDSEGESEDEQNA